MKLLCRPWDAMCDESYSNLDEMLGCREDRKEDAALYAEMGWGKAGGADMEEYDPDISFRMALRPPGMWYDEAMAYFSTTDGE